MKKLILDFLSGRLFIDDLYIAPLNIKDFLLTAESLIEGENNYSHHYGLTSYQCGDVKFGAYPFKANVFFNNNILEVVSLHWLGGATEIKGWNSSDSDLIHDKASLTRLVKKIIGRDANKKEDFEDVFEFEWGSIFVRGVRIAMYPKIDICWIEKNT